MGWLRCAAPERSTSCTWRYRSSEVVKLNDLTDRLQNSTASIYLVPDLLVFDLMQPRSNAPVMSR